VEVQRFAGSNPMNPSNPMNSRNLINKLGERLHVGKGTGLGLGRHEVV